MRVPASMSPVTPAKWALTRVRLPSFPFSIIFYFFFLHDAHTCRRNRHGSFRFLARPRRPRSAFVILHGARYGPKWRVDTKSLSVTASVTEVSKASDSLRFGSVDFASTDRASRQSETKLDPKTTRLG
jgi:hypothetical protein